MLRTKPSRFAPPRQKVSQVQTIPPPVGGINARDTIANMDPSDAVILDNWFPQRHGVELRHGSLLWSVSGPGISIETLMVYVDHDGTEKLIAVGGHWYYNITNRGTPTMIGSYPEHGGLFNGRFQYTVYTNAFDNFLVMVNGANIPQKYDGTTWSHALYTGPADPNKLICVLSHHRRLWFVEKDSSTAWFGHTDEIQGELIAYSFGEMFPRGGYLMALGSWSVDSGSGMNDMLVAVSSEGDVVVMQGIDPLDFSFQPVGQFFIGKPLGRRCMCNMLADLLVLTVEGVIPMSRVLAARDETVHSIAVTEKIQAMLALDIDAFKDNFGWEVVFAAGLNQLYINVPDPDGARQYVMNTITKAWCRFIGYKAQCFAVFGRRPFYADVGSVYKGYEGHLDLLDLAGVGKKVSARAVQAFSYFGSGPVQKRFLLARPVFLAAEVPAVGFNFAIDYEFDERELALPEVTVELFSNVWDVAIWDQTPLYATSMTTYKRWYGVTPIGFCGAPALTLSSGAQTFWVSTDVLIEAGGVL